MKNYTGAGERRELPPRPDDGDHLILKWEPPANHDSETRTVVVPAHDSVSIGTLRDIDDDAGAEDFESFCEWIDQNA
ncbi:type II toxin-antitoxin system HicA family toxin [Haloarcula amylovorans]|uniref:type II toxin-antitoxin system HicA family toxin n=1 Tax=Haloarcula amylovorans TaxID=2562280 RepID=UPI001FD833F6|nr:type II toxin-antitoxin system HicA family toxin [Halomicroarcula amylolytica]